MPCSRPAATPRRSAILPRSSNRRARRAAPLAAPPRASGESDVPPGVGADTAQPLSSSPALIPITFLPSGATTSAPAGSPMMAAADAAGVDLPAGCFSGSCGICEVEVSTTAPGSGAPLADRVVQRACIAVIPAGVGGVTIAELEDDAVWGQDGWDT